MIWAPSIRTHGNADDAGDRLTCDAWNRLIVVTNSTANGGTVLALYTYDGMGRQVTQNDVGISSTGVLYSAQGQVLAMNGEKFIWSAVDPSALVVRDDGSFSETLPVLRTYVLHDAMDDNTSMVQLNLAQGDTNGDTNVDISDLNAVTSHWMDHTGNGTADGDLNHDGVVNQLDLDIVDADWQEHGLPSPTWQVVARAIYDANGNAAFTDGDWNNDASPSTANFVNMPFLWQGLQQDTVTGLYENNARIYDPTTGRFMQQDPLGYVDGMNDYESRADNPINRVDPTGLCNCGPDITGQLTRLATRARNLYFAMPQKDRHTASDYTFNGDGWDIAELKNQAIFSPPVTHTDADHTVEVWGSCYFEEEVNYFLLGLAYRLQKSKSSQAAALQIVPESLFADRNDWVDFLHNYGDAPNTLDDAVAAYRLLVRPFSLDFSAWTDVRGTAGRQAWAKAGFYNNTYFPKGTEAELKGYTFKPGNKYPGRLAGHWGKLLFSVW